MRRALQPVYEKLKRQRRTGYLAIKRFFELYATLDKDFVDAFNWCKKDLKITTDWEGQLCGLFRDAYPHYP